MAIKSQLSDWFNQTCHICHGLRWFFIAALISVFIVWGVLGWYQLYIWYYDDTPAAEFGAGSISDSTVMPFQTVVFKQSIKKLRNCPGHVQRVITGECGHHLIYSGETSLQAGFNGQLTYPVVIPDRALPGRCEFYVTATYRCNFFDEWLHRQVFQSPPIRFTVIERKAP